MSRSIRRGASAAALALASSTLLATVATAAPAGAVTASGPAFFSGATAADVVQIQLNLPQAIGPLPQELGLSLISARGNALHDAIGGKADVSNSVARLAGGNLIEGDGALLSALDRSVSASLDAPSAADRLASLPSNPIAKGAVGDLSALVTKTTVGNTSTANLTRATVLQLGDLLGADVLNQLKASVDGVAPQAQGVLDSAVDQLNGIVATVQKNDATGQSQQVTQVVNTLTDALDSLQVQLPVMLDAALSSPVVTLDALDANQTIDRAGDGVTSQAHAKLLGLDILGGLVTVDGFVSDAVATANGKAGGAKASYNPIIAKASVGNGLLGVQLDAAGIGLTGSGLPADVQAQVNAVLAQVQAALNGVLSAIGLTITPVEGSSSVTPDGKTATATGGSMIIALTPPTMSKPVLQVRLGGTTAATNVAQAGKPGEMVNQPRPPALPHTGANLPLAGGAGLVLLLGAALIRRRMAS